MRGVKRPFPINECAAEKRPYPISKFAIHRSSLIIHHSKRPFPINKCAAEKRPYPINKLADRKRLYLAGVFTIYHASFKFLCGGQMIFRRYVILDTMNGVFTILRFEAVSGQEMF